MDERSECCLGTLASTRCGLPFLSPPLDMWWHLAWDSPLFNPQSLCWSYRRAASQATVPPVKQVQSHPRAFSLAAPSAWRMVGTRVFPWRCLCFLLSHPCVLCSCPILGVPQAHSGRGWGTALRVQRLQRGPCCPPICQPHLLVNMCPGRSRHCLL